MQMMQEHFSKIVPNPYMAAFYWISHKLEDTLMAEWKTQRERKDDVKLVYEIHWINLQCSVLYIGRTKVGKDETEITNGLINLSCTRGIRDNKTH